MDNNDEVNKKKNHTRKLREKCLNEIPNTLRWRQAELVLSTFKNSCALTGKSSNVQLDHFIPVNWGKIVRKYGIGGTTYANMIPLDRSINASKSSMNPSIWFETYHKRHGISIEKWNYAVRYIADKHKMAVSDYINRVNACYSEIIATKWIAEINSKIEADGKVHLVYIDRALRNNLNITVVVGVFGSSKTKDYFRSNQGLELLRERKEDFQSRLNRREVLLSVEERNYDRRQE